MKTICCLFISLFLAQVAIAQSTYRIKFKYRVTANKLASLNAANLHIEDAGGKTYQLCPTLPHGAFLCQITNDKGKLVIDPWSVLDYRIDPSHATVKDPCYQQPGIINADTDNTLFIQLPKRPKVGSPTVPAVIHYRTWLIGVNSIGLKVRPSVKDFNGKEYQASISTANVNLGFSAGYSHGWTKFTHRSSNSFSVTPGFSFGFSSATLGKEILKKQIDVSSSPSNLILSPAATITLARNEIGIILAYGTDLMTGKNASAWAYQGRMYFGLGLSAAFKL
jgi:hypothetical protein